MLNQNLTQQCPICFQFFTSDEIQFHAYSCLEKKIVDDDFKLAKQLSNMPPNNIPLKNNGYGVNNNHPPNKMNQQNNQNPPRIVQSNNNVQNYTHQQNMNGNSNNYLPQRSNSQNIITTKELSPRRTYSQQIIVQPTINQNYPISNQNYKYPSNNMNPQINNQQNYMSQNQYMVQNNNTRVINQQQPLISNYPLSNPIPMNINMVQQVPTNNMMIGQSYPIVNPQIGYPMNQMNNQQRINQNINFNNNQNINQMNNNNNNNNINNVNNNVNRNPPMSNVETKYRKELELDIDYSNVVIDIQKLLSELSSDSKPLDLFKDYAQILNNPSEFTKKVDMEVMRRIKISKYDPPTIRKLLFNIFRYPDHEFSKVVEHFCKVIHHNLSRPNANRINFSAHISHFVSRFSNYIADGYYEGVTDVDFLQVTFRDIVFLKVEKGLYFHYCKKYQSLDLKLRNKISNFLILTPSHLKIEKNYRLEDSKLPESPYRSAIHHLSGIENTIKLKEKLQILCELNNVIPKAISNFKTQLKNLNNPPNENNNNIENEPLDVIGADQFVPIFHYTFLKSFLRNPIAQYKFLEDFTVSSEQMGENGYMIATFHSAINYFANITMKELEENFKKINNEEKQKEIEQTKKLLEKGQDISIQVLQPISFNSHSNSPSTLSPPLSNSPKDREDLVNTLKNVNISTNNEISFNTSNNVNNVKDENNNSPSMTNINFDKDNLISFDFDSSFSSFNNNSNKFDDKSGDNNTSSPSLDGRFTVTLQNNTLHLSLNNSLNFERDFENNDDVEWVSGEQNFEDPFPGEDFKFQSPQTTHKDII